MRLSALTFLEVATEDGRTAQNHFEESVVLALQRRIDYLFNRQGEAALEHHLCFFLWFCASPDERHSVDFRAEI
jgi:hypothetical protein